MLTQGDTTLPIFFTSCSNAGKFSLRGDFRNLRGGDFYIYSTDGGSDRIDTLHIVEGQFKWEIPLEKEATFYVIFPNLSEQIIFAHPGDVIKMKGDAQQLRATRITGNKENELLTRFREEHADDSRPELMEAMKNFIADNPESRISTYFTHQMMIQKATTSRLRKGQQLDDITLPPDGLDPGQDTLRLDSLKPVLLTFWATWKRNSQDDLYAIRKSLKDYGKDHIQTISISLDTDIQYYRNACRYDSLTWHSRCYRLTWETPLIKQLNIKDIPYYVLTDSKHKIIALGTDWKRDIEPELKK